MSADKRQRARRASPSSASILSRLGALFVWLLLGSLLAGVGAVAAYAVWLDAQITTHFEGRRWALPARLYARPLELYPGLRFGAADLQAELDLLGYQRVTRIERPGSYVRRGDVLDVHTRSFRFWDGVEPARRLQVSFGGESVRQLQETGAQAPALVRLEPVLVARIYPSHNEDRVLVRLQDVPPLLLQALIAVEDRSFYQHRGVDLSAIARAFRANIRAGRTVQGGSTLTQQLVKNFFLTDERTFRRKFTEFLMAVLLEWRYDKNAILEAYLNEVFLGQQGARAIHGFGLAAEFYFSRQLQELRLHELALLVGIVRGAAYYNPRKSPERALARRNLVLSQMAELGFVDGEAAQAAKAEPLGVTDTPAPAVSPYPAFVDLARRQLQRDYREEDLRTEGLQIFTTLDPHAQRAAEHALRKRLERFEAARKQPPGTLQGAVIVTNAEAGEVLAVVASRTPGEYGFNRALDAVRPIGSLVKPAVYLTALERGEGFTPASILSDDPVRIRGEDGQIWTPSNYDGKSHGDVPMHRALASSYNLATVRLGMDVGLRKVIRTLRRLGVERDIPAYPSLLLGAISLTPLEVAGMYQTLANLGFRSPLRAIREVVGADGKPLNRYRLAVEQTLDPAAVFLVNTLLQQVMSEGTGRSAYERLPGRPALAGKTGTTDDLRDSWFAGFGGDRLAVVWVGRDDNKPAGFSGSAGALQIWADVMQTMYAGSWAPPLPDGVHWAWVDRETGLTTDAECPGSLRLPFLAGTEPRYSGCGGRGFTGNLEDLH